MREPRRVYADTSVFGGCQDPEFAEPSRRFFDEVRAGRFVLVISSLVTAELSLAPAAVRQAHDEILPIAEAIEPSADALRLQQAYLSAGIVTAKSADDALHVATAVVAQCRLVVSWNFRHIVHLDKIRLYNAINALHGYEPIEVHAPPEVLHYEEDL